MELVVCFSQAGVSWMCVTMHHHCRPHSRSPRVRFSDVQEAQSVEWCHATCRSHFYPTSPNPSAFLDLPLRSCSTTPNYLTSQQNQLKAKLHLDHQGPQTSSYQGPIWETGLTISAKVIGEDPIKFVLGASVCLATTRDQERNNENGFQGWQRSWWICCWKAWHSWDGRKVKEPQSTKKQSLRKNVLRKKGKKESWLESVF